MNLEIERFATLYYVLVVFGYLLARMPKPVVRAICVLCGNIAMVALPSRRRLVISNLRHAFPNRSLQWCKRICRENFCRLIELGLLSMAGSFFRKKQIKSSFKINGQYKKTIESIINNDNGAIILMPHFTSMEAMTFLGDIIDDIDLPDIGVIYRPFGNASLEKFVKKTREKCGMKLFSRKSGFFELMKILRVSGVVSLLFDQNAGESGYLMSFFNRVVSSTDLPCLLHEKFKSPVYFLYPRRTGFWKANITIKKLSFDESDPKTILFAANKYLEDILRSSDGACADWLWAHDRWKIATANQNCSRREKRNWINESLKFSEIYVPQKTLKVFVRMPNWLGDVIMAIPVLRMIKASRQDVELTLICQKQFFDFLKATNIADEIIELPEKNFSYFFKFGYIKNAYPDIYISLINSLRGDIEAVLIGAAKKIGIDTKNRFYRKLFIKNIYDCGEKFDATSIHQTKLWEEMLKKYGLGAKENFSSFKFCIDAGKIVKPKYSIGIVCGSANEPRKRWPAESWKILIERIFEKYDDAHINLYGTKSDSVFTDEVALFFNRATVSNLVGQTNILELANQMQKDDLIISIDTGGMHLASMFGCPLICIYGVTNPVSTGPIFDSKKIIVMPESCPAKGGFPTEDVEVDAVFKAVRLMLK